MVSMKSASVKAAIRRQVMRPVERQSDLAAIHIDPLGEFFLFDGIVKHRKIVADLQRPFGSLD